MKKKCLKFSDQQTTAEKMLDSLINLKSSRHLNTAAAVFFKLQLFETNSKTKVRRFTLVKKLLNL